MNVWLGSGRLTRDCETRTTSTGKVVSKFGLASNEGKNEDGSNRVTFIECEVWGHEKMLPYLTKGKPIEVKGRLKNDNWEDSEGNKRSRMLVAAEKIDFSPGSSAPNTNEDAEETTVTKKVKDKTKPRKEKVTVPADDEDDDSIPF